HPLRLRGDRVEHQRALARAGDAGEHRQPVLRDLDAEVLEVVLARAVHTDQIVAVGSVLLGRRRGRLLGHAFVSPSLGPPPGFSTVALASRALPTRLSTVLGWDTHERQREPTEASRRT